MTDIKLLALLIDYQKANLAMSTLMLWAVEDFARGRQQHSWNWLIDWCVAKDEREELWERFKHDYPRAIMFKEGRNVWLNVN